MSMSHELLGTHSLSLAAEPGGHLTPNVIGGGQRSNNP